MQVFLSTQLDIVLRDTQYSIACQVVLFCCGGLIGFGGVSFAVLEDPFCC